MHWVYADRLKARFPRAEVDPQPLFIDDGDVLTSAGSASRLDLCLHLVRQNLGPGSPTSWPAAWSRRRTATAARRSTSMLPTAPRRRPHRPDDGRT